MKRRSFLQSLTAPLVLPLVLKVEPPAIQAADVVFDVGDFMSVVLYKDTGEEASRISIIAEFQQNENGDLQLIGKEDAIFKDLPEGQVIGSWGAIYKDQEIVHSLASSEFLVTNGGDITLQFGKK